MPALLQPQSIVSCSMFAHTPFGFAPTQPAATEVAASLSCAPTDRPPPSPPSTWWPPTPPPDMRSVCCRGLVGLPEVAIFIATPTVTHVCVCVCVCVGPVARVHVLHTLHNGGPWCLSRAPLCALVWSRVRGHLLAAYATGTVAAR